MYEEMGTRSRIPVGSLTIACQLMMTTTVLFWMGDTQNTSFVSTRESSLSFSGLEKRLERFRASGSFDRHKVSANSLSTW